MIITERGIPAETTGKGIPAVVMKKDMAAVDVTADVAPQSLPLKDATWEKW